MSVARVTPQPLLREPAPKGDRLMSVTEAARHLERPASQMQLLGDAHVLGQTFSLMIPDNRKNRDTSTRESTLVKAGHVEWLASRRTWTKKSLSDSSPLPGRAVVIVRHLGRQDLDADAARQDNRLYYGYDHSYDHAGPQHPELVYHQDEASRRWWPISAANRDLLGLVSHEGSFLPMLLTVGGLVVGAREITGLDHELSHTHTGSPKKWAMTVRPAGDWFDDSLAYTWILAGAGRPILWWPLKAA